MKLLTIIFAIVCINSAYANDCKPVGSLETFHDPSCANGGMGCNAGGQVNCRFCGFDNYPDCPKPTQPPKPTPSTQKTSRTTRSTTKRTTRAPSNSTGDGNGSGGNCNCNGNHGGFNEVYDEVNEYGERLIFKDDFDFLDFKKWKHDLTMSGGGNWEFQLYHNNRTNTFVEDGIFKIKPTLTEERIGADNLREGYRMDMWGGSPVDQCTGNNFYGCERISGAGGNILNPIQSGKISTVESFSFKYGRVEVVAKLPRGDWLWPAIWLLPQKNEYGMWPASGEIDIMESRGNDNYPHSAEGGCDSYGSTLHWGVDWTQNRYEKTHEVYHHDNGRLSDDFHTYGLYWSETELYTYIDDPSNVVLDVDLTAETFHDRGQFPENYDNPWKNAEDNGEWSAPFNKEFHLIINLAVGGTVGFFPDGVGGKPWTNDDGNAVNKFYAAKNQWYETWKNDDVALEIDSVKVWSFE